MISILSGINCSKPSQSTKLLRVSATKPKCRVLWNSYRNLALPRRRVVSTSKKGLLHDRTFPRQVRVTGRMRAGTLLWTWLTCPQTTQLQPPISAKSPCHAAKVSAQISRRINPANVNSYELRHCRYRQLPKKSDSSVE